MNSWSLVFLDIGIFLLHYYIGQCPELPPLANGDITLSSPERLNGTTATYTCDSGYVLTGSRMRTCQTNGAWEEPAPFCDRESLTHNYDLTVE